MIGVFGFRSHKVLEDVTEGDLIMHGGIGGGFVYLEVTNKGQSDTKFYPNVRTIYGEQVIERATDGIPIPAGQTRAIPMAVYNFRADDPVTVVAYRM